MIEIKALSPHQHWQEAVIVAQFYTQSGNFSSQKNILIQNNQNKW
jgi:hypothetical protein